MKGSPALDAGMQAGDIIEKIDGTLYTGEQLNAATRVLKGQEGTNVKVTIVRDGKEEELNIRHNLASRTSDLLKRVFSKQDK